MSVLKLSTHGHRLIELYSQMVSEGFERTDGNTVKPANVYNAFQLQKFRNMVKNQISNEKINTVLDYGGGGSNWDAVGFEPSTGETAKQFFGITDVTTFEPARGLMKKERLDCVICVDVLEHIFLADIANLVSELFSLAKYLLVINVACYKAAALLPNGENAHITVRSPDWWKGVIDTTASKFGDVEVILICSTGFIGGVVYEPFKSNDWHKSEKFSIDSGFRPFK